MKTSSSLAANQGGSANQNLFSQLTSAASQDLAAIGLAVTYPKGAVLFFEREQARGVFLLREGLVKLSITSSEGKRLIVRIAHAGEVVGLMSVLGGSAYEATAETIRPCKAAYVRSDDFLRFAARYPAISCFLGRQICTHYQEACTQLRTVALSASAKERLARLLLNWVKDTQENSDKMKLFLTHEEIAEIIGTSRETVTRILSDFRQRHLVAVGGSTLTIADRKGLQSLIHA